MRGQHRTARRSQREGPPFTIGHSLPSGNEEDGHASRSGMSRRLARTGPPPARSDQCKILSQLPDNWVDANIRHVPRARARCFARAISSSVQRLASRATLRRLPLLHRPWLRPTQHPRPPTLPRSLRPLRGCRRTGQSFPFGLLPTFRIPDLGALPCTPKPRPMNRRIEPRAAHQQTRPADEICWSPASRPNRRAAFRPDKTATLAYRNIPC